MSGRVRTVFMTAPDLDAAEKLATTLVGARLAACANLVPRLTSVYWWQGSIERADEVLLILKTSEERVKELMSAAVEIHPYDVPEILVLPVEHGHGPYLDWVEAETRTVRVGEESEDSLG